MTAVLLRVLCSWCGVVLREGTLGAPTSHGLCRSCQTTLERDLDAIPSCSPVLAGRTAAGNPQRDTALLVGA